MDGRRNIWLNGCPNYRALGTRLHTPHTANLLPAYHTPPTHLVDIPKTISGGKVVLFLPLFLSWSSLLRMSCVALNCACSCAVVSPDCTADLFSEIKSFSATFLWLGDLVGQCAFQLERASVWGHRRGDVGCTCVQCVSEASLF